VKPPPPPTPSFGVIEFETAAWFAEVLNLMHFEVDSLFIGGDICIPTFFLFFFFRFAQGRVYVFPHWFFQAQSLNTNLFFTCPAQSKQEVRNP
jgi:hypothetical protein